MMQRFYYLNFFIIPQIDCLELGSRPEEGSSKKTILLPPIKELAKHNFLLFPPDKFLLNLPLSAPRAHF
jgi:hypothetical protein